MMFKPQVEAKDISDIEALVADLFIQQPHNPDGSMKQQISFSAHESKMLVATVNSAWEARLCGDEAAAYGGVIAHRT